MLKFSVRLPAVEYYVISGPTYLPSAATKYHNCVIMALTYLPSAEINIIISRKNILLKNTFFRALRAAKK